MKGLTVKRRIAAGVLGVAAAGLILAGCAATGGSPTGAYGPAPSASSSSTPAAGSGTDLRVTPTTLGEIVVDGEGMTAYFFDKDTPNSTSSACTGQCAKVWPAITTTSGTPTVSGVTGAVGTITGAAGGKQITINGRPIYRYSGDTAPGDTRGQGIGSVWYVISPAGAEITSSKGGY
jgi:predicted lipoprotein with Yx(FWY)xxD motif